MPEPLPGILAPVPRLARRVTLRSRPGADARFQFTTRPVSGADFRCPPMEGGRLVWTGG